MFVYEVGKISLPGAFLAAGSGLGIIAAFAFLASRGQSVTFALTIAAIVGTLTNTIGVLGMGVLRGYWAAGVAWTVGVTQGIPEAIVAAIITVAVVTTWKSAETGIGRRQAQM